MRKARCANLAPVGPLAAVADDKDSHFALRGFDGTVGFSWGDGVAFCEEEEVVDQGLHILLHRRSRWRGDFVVLHPDGARWHLVQALMNNSQALPKFLHSAKISIITIPIHTNRHIKFDLIIRIIRLALPYIPRYPRAAQHDATETIIESIGGGDNADVLGPTFPDAVVSEEFFGFVDAVAELGGPLVDVVEKAQGKVRVNAAGADICGVETGAGDALVELLRRGIRSLSWESWRPQKTYHKLFALFKPPEKGR